MEKIFSLYEVFGKYMGQEHAKGSISVIDNIKEMFSRARDIGLEPKAIDRSELNGKTLQCDGESITFVIADRPDNKKRIEEVSIGCYV
ncbi:MAG: hypothetical protein ACK4VI_06530 [Alphaproteobacteria bacterium]